MGSQSNPFVQPFLFDRRFDYGGREHADEAPPEPPAPVFSLADLEAARADGVTLGRAEALAEAQVQLKAGQMQGATLQAVCERLSLALDQIDAAAGQATRDAIQIAAAIARRLLPSLYARHGASEVEELVAATLSGLPSDSSVSIRLAPSMAESLAPLLLQRAKEYGRGDRLHVSGDASVAEGDCAMEWMGGGLLRNRESLWREIEILIEQEAGPLRHGAAEPEEGHERGS
jgi:flagellar assembly protein FliH